eukprot:1377532-Pleurochrysis_carterae.AAC.3
MAATSTRTGWVRRGAAVEWETRNAIATLHAHKLSTQSCLIHNVMQEPRSCADGSAAQQERFQFEVRSCSFSSTKEGIATRVKRGLSRTSVERVSDLVIRHSGEVELELHLLLAPYLPHSHPSNI